MRVKEWLVSYSKGNNLGLFWALFRLRERVRGRFVRKALTFFLSRIAHRRGGYIGNGARFAGVPTLPHGLHGVFISQYARIGADCWIYQNVTIGEVDRRAPEIGAGCLIGADAILVGGIKVGDHARIGAGAVVSVDVPAGATVVAQPPRVILGR